MGQINLRKVSKSFGATTIIPQIDLDIADAEFVVFVGPSGCGKSTLLRLIAGLEDVTAYPKITLALLRRGLSASDVEKIWGGNTLRVRRAAAHRGLPTASPRNGEQRFRSAL